MGQYYIPIIKRNNGTFETYDSHDYDNGLKLMEHSYVGNSFVDESYRKNQERSRLWCLC